MTIFHALAVIALFTVVIIAVLIFDKERNIK
jgi:hypothetical protein